MSHKPLYKSLYVQVITAIVIGVLLGHFAPATGEAMKPLGDGFIKLIKMIIAPIIFCTVVVGIAGMEDMKKVGKTGGLALLYFEIVSSLALVVGLVIINLLQPGVGMHVDAKSLDTKGIAAYTGPGKMQSTTDFLLNVIPSSVVDAFAKGEILQVLFFSVLFGTGLAVYGKPAKPVVDLIDRVSHALFRVIGFIMHVAPIGAFGAMAFTVGAYGVGALWNLVALIGTFYLTSVLFAVSTSVPVPDCVSVPPPLIAPPARFSVPTPLFSANVPAFVNVPVRLSTPAVPPPARLNVPRLLNAPPRFTVPDCRSISPPGLLQLFDVASVPPLALSTPPVWFVTSVTVIVCPELAASIVALFVNNVKFVLPTVPPRVLDAPPTVSPPPSVSVAEPTLVVIRLLLDVPPNRIEPGPLYVVFAFDDSCVALPVEASVIARPDAMLIVPLVVTISPLGTVTLASTVRLENVAPVAMVAPRAPLTVSVPIVSLISVARLPMRRRVAPSSVSPALLCQRPWVSATGSMPVL